MKKTSVILGMIFFSFFVSVPAAFPWGWAVHTYIDEQFATKWHLRNANQLYGGLAPDMFNFRFDAPAYKDYLFEKTHHDFMRVWHMAKSEPAKALAFGFVSHNEQWGTDSTAHRSGITVGQQGGYVIAKAYALKEMVLDPLLSSAGLPLPEPIVLTVAHELVERGVDLLMKELDPMIGAKMAAAALPPNPSFPLLMEKVYAGDLTAHFRISRKDAVKFLTSSERQFRQIMVLYGQALMLDVDAAVPAMAEQLASMATAFLAAYGISLPDDDVLVPLLEFGIWQAMAICAADFAGEVTATAEFVEQQLRAHGISY